MGATPYVGCDTLRTSSAVNAIGQVKVCARFRPKNNDEDARATTVQETEYLNYVTDMEAHGPENFTITIFPIVPPDHASCSSYTRATKAAIDSHWTGCEPPPFLT